MDGIKPTESNLQVLIVSYETFRMHHEKFKDASSCDLLICDEAHRLKNDQTLTNKVEAAPANHIRFSSKESFLLKMCVAAGAGQAGMPEAGAAVWDALAKPPG